MILVIGNLNANTGKSRLGIESVLGPWTNPAERKEPGEALIDLCVSHDMVITNTFYKHPTCQRDTFCGHTGNSTPKLLVYVLINRRYRTSVRDTRVYRETRAVVDSNHELIISKTQLRLKARRHHRDVKPRLALQKPRDERCLCEGCSRVSH